MWRTALTPFSSPAAKGINRFLCTFGDAGHLTQDSISAAKWNSDTDAELMKRLQGEGLGVECGRGGVGWLMGAEFEITPRIKQNYIHLALTS